MMKAPRGFSLLEMAVVLMVVTLLLGGMLIPLATQVEQKRIAETQKTLADVQEALIGYAIANGKLPCPDRLDTATGNDGKEDRSGGSCDSTEGNLPWATLGVGTIDAWGNRLHYVIDPQFTTNFSLATTGVLKVCADYQCLALAGDKLPAVVLSYGKNGYAAVNANRPPGAPPLNAAPPASNQDELLNATALSQIFVSRQVTAPSTPCNDNVSAGSARCEFDDLVVWVSPNILFNRMVAAGKLP